MWVLHIWLVYVYIVFFSLVLLSIFCMVHCVVSLEVNTIFSLFLTVWFLLLFYALGYFVCFLHHPSWHQHPYQLLQLCSVGVLWSDSIGSHSHAFHKEGSPQTSKGEVFWCEALLWLFLFFKASLPLYCFISTATICSSYLIHYYSLSSFIWYHLLKW